ncbi:MAG: acylglycerol kinase family protein, partial [Candidatus Mariimomonas ferrooxydans]
MKANLIVNPIAGNRAYRSIKKIEALLRQKVSFTTQVTRKKGDAFAFARDITETDLIIVAGGDGTFNEVINGMLSSKPEATSYPLPSTLPQPSLNPGSPHYLNHHSHRA